MTDLKVADLIKVWYEDDPEDTSDFGEITRVKDLGQGRTYVHVLWMRGDMKTPLLNSTTGKPLEGTLVWQDALTGFTENDEAVTVQKVGVAWASIMVAMHFGIYAELGAGSEDWVQRLLS